MTAISSYRKCYKCGNESTEIEKSKCKCGNYMYLISQVYIPKAQAKEVKDNG